MSKPIRLPAITLTQGVEFYKEYQWLRGDTPVDMSTGWTGEIVLKRGPKDPDLWRGAVALTADGEIKVTVPGDVSLPARPKLGAFAMGVFEITVSSDDDGEVFQGVMRVVGRV